MRPHIITLGYKDLERSRRFYEQGLGFKASSASQDDIVFYPTGGAVLALYPRKLLAKDAAVPPKGSGFAGLTLAYNVKTKAEVSTVLAKAAKAGGKITKVAEDAVWGGHSGYFADPDGNLWEVAWNPFFKFDQNGNLKLPR
ncbi:MAG TPA: VOC family protein [bacterium]|nr:VOC family protein [bacterium]